jgi:hypothetical protein
MRMRKKIVVKRRLNCIHASNPYFFPSSTVYDTFGRGNYGAADHDAIVERKLMHEPRGLAAERRTVVAMLIQA